VLSIEKVRKIIGVEESKQLTDKQVQELVNFFYLLVNIKVNHKKKSSDEESSNYVSGKQRRTS